MLRDERNLEQRVADIVVDAIASGSGLGHDKITRDLRLNDLLDSLELTDLHIAIEEDCEDLEELRLHPRHFSIEDSELSRAETVGDLIRITQDTIISTLSGQGEGSGT
jgi:hypothetical protein